MIENKIYKFTCLYTVAFILTCLLLHIFIAKLNNHLFVQFLINCLPSRTSHFFFQLMVSEVLSTLLSFIKLQRAIQSCTCCLSFCLHFKYFLSHWKMCMISVMHIFDCHWNKNIILLIQFHCFMFSSATLFLVFQFFFPVLLCFFSAFINFHFRIKVIWFRFQLDSLEKLNKLLNACRHIGIEINPAVIDGLGIVPLFSWYHEVSTS